MATKFRFNLNNQLVDFDDFYVRKDQFLQSRSGNLWTWGRNLFGQLGDNTTTHRSSPVQTIAFANDWKQVSCGDFYNTAAIKKDGTLWTWGQNSYGQLGNNSAAIFSGVSSPIQTVTFANNWAQVSSQAAAIKTDGTLWTWGIAEFGRLGDNTLTDKSSPVQTITFTNNWTQVSCSGVLTAAIKTDGTLWTWGRNNDGQLGDNTRTHRSSPVQTITFANNWTQVSCGNSYTAAIKTDGTLWTWGRNAYGQLGDNTTTHRSSPVQTIAFGGNWKQVTCGDSHTAAIKTDGTLWTWGRNALGQLGDNTRTHRSSPVQTIAFGGNWKQVTCGGSHTAAIKTDGTLWIWGSNAYGQLGDNTRTHRSSPVQTIAFRGNWKQVSCGYSTTAAISYID